MSLWEALKTGSVLWPYVLHTRVERGAELWTSWWVGSAGPTWGRLRSEQELGWQYQTHLWCMLDSGLPFSLGTTGFRLFSTCCPLGFIKPGPSACAGAVCSSWDEAQHLQVRGPGSHLKKAGLPSPGWWRGPASSGGAQRSRLLFKSEGKMEQEIDGWINAASTLLWLGYRSIMVKKELRPRAKLSSHWSVAPTLSYELWVMTKKTRSWM